MIYLRSSPHYGHFRCERASLLSTFLQKNVGLSNLRIQTLFDFRALYLNGERIFAEQELQVGDVLRVHFQPKRFLIPEKLKIIFEDDDFIGIDKPYGLPTHPTVDNYLENAWSILQKQMGQKVYVTHRLDTGTEGVLVLAKSQSAQSEFNQYLRERTVHKIYRAATDAPVPLGRHEHYIQTEGPVPKPTFATPVEDSAVAILHVRESWQHQDGYGCEVELETGRTHQIRAQLSFLGCPIWGDRTYGCQRVDKKNVHERLALECFSISFTHRSRTIGIYRPTSLVAPPEMSPLIQATSPSTKDSLEKCFQSEIARYENDAK